MGLFLRYNNRIYQYVSIYSYEIHFCSVWIGYNDLQWVGAWNVFRDTLELSMLSGAQRH